MQFHPAADVFPMLGEDELRELAKDIQAHGLLEPIWIYDDPELGKVLLDGRNRLAACEIAGVEPETRFYTGDDPVSFVVSQNVHRRHLTTGQKAAAAHKLKPLFEAQARRRQVEAAREAALNRPRDELGRLQVGADRRQPGDATTEPQQPAAKQEKRAPKAAAQAAKAVGSSGRAVERYERVSKQAPDLLPKIDSGEISLDRAERIIRDREAEQRRIKEAKQQAKAIEARCKIDLRIGDFRDVLADLRGIDAIITDPPYPREFLPLLADLAKFADRVLAEDGILAVLIGQTYLPDVFRLLDGGRPYRWTACYHTPGPGYRSHSARVQSNWKPLLVYGGGPRFGDVVSSSGTDADAKNYHRWGQDYGAFHQIVERLTKPGQTIVDPFAGGGTTLLAAHALGRHAIGAEIDEHAYHTALERLS